MAHITGGGLLENLPPRSLPKGIVAEIDGHPTLPPVFAWMKQVSGLADREMLRTFNCGIGMVLIVSKDHTEEAKSLLRQAGESVIYDLGFLISGDGEQVIIKQPL
jgi:phosphoribosylaminoimidazole (AIR) synthetase